MPELIELADVVKSNFTISEALALLQPLTLFILGVAVYSFFIFKFYRFVARREIFEFKSNSDSAARNFFNTIFYMFKYIILFPVITFFWFLVLAAILAFLSKQGDMQTILLISISLVAVIRIMAYYNEDLSKDLAKMMPFALLGVFLVDISFFSISTSLNSISQLPSLWKSIIYYLVFLILLEFILRVFYGIFGRFQKPAESDDE